MPNYKILDKKYALPDYSEEDLKKYEKNINYIRTLDSPVNLMDRKFPIPQKKNFYSKDY